MALLSARSIRIGTTILAAVSLAVSITLATRALAHQSQERDAFASNVPQAQPIATR
jgi:hypothetical protein